MDSLETSGAPTVDDIPIFSEDARKKFETIKRRFSDKRMWIIPTLILAQREFGYLSKPVMRMVSELVSAPLAHILDVASFYTLMYTEPVGRHVVQVCQTISCSLCGADSITDHLESRFGIGVGETTADGRFTLQKVECLGSCGTAPVVQINDDYHENLSIEKLDQILDTLT